MALRSHPDAWLATQPDWQRRVRAEPALLPAAIDEVLRIDGPLVANRRITREAVELGGQALAAGERLSINWIAANRDPALNLLYGPGVHVCPGAPLARLELRVLMEELLARSTDIAFVEGLTFTRAVYPDAGYATLRVRLS